MTTSTSQEPNVKAKRNTKAAYVRKSRGETETWFG